MMLFRGIKIPILNTSQPCKYFTGTIEDKDVKVKFKYDEKGNLVPDIKGATK